MSSLAPAHVEVEAGVGAKADQYASNPFKRVNGIYVSPLPWAFSFNILLGTQNQNAVQKDTIYTCECIHSNKNKKWVDLIVKIILQSEPVCMLSLISGWWKNLL